MNKYIFFLLFVLIFVIVFTFNFKRQKTVGIFGSISYENFDKSQIQKLANNLSNKYKYIIPNSSDGVLGYLLDNIPDNLKIKTYYCSIFPEEKINKRYKPIIINNLLDFELEMLNNSDKIVILNGGIGTLFELSYGLLSIVEENNKEIILYNNNGFYDKILEHIGKLRDEGYLRNDNLGRRLKIAHSVEEILYLINK